MNFKTTALATALIASAGVATTADAGALIYEPFADDDASLAGNNSGLGLDGTWQAGGISVLSGSQTFFDLQVSGNRAVRTGGGNFNNAFISPGTTLTDEDLLGDTAILWFSALVVSDPGRRTYVALGTGNADGFDRIGGTGGFGVGIRVENGRAHAHGWDNTGAVKPAGPTVDDGTVLVVGKITWAPDGSNDKVELFLPTGIGLAQPVAPVSTMLRDFDQSAFDTISFAGGAAGSIPSVDEIRFGKTYRDVVPVPEPSSLALIAMGGLAMMRRRR